jgi:hypothetical protein
MPKTRRYSIEIKDAYDKSKLCTAADWTDKGLRVVVAQIIRLTILSKSPIAGSCSIADIGCRTWPGGCPSYLHRDHGSADFLGSNGTWHFRRVASAGSRLAALHKRPDMLGGELPDVSHRVLLVGAVCGEVP